ncbi:flippase-like domain-containing protein [Rhodoblastus acidophilus]|uniref:Flippase-like domain-containing protein n=1 Tax=Rhodoblastus acidophilus TaxID=1074 RepID=A0A6N8DS70_RHOAC|nr:flippase-like domain-containing protein [Rhodoblastus acidophilus]MCW2275781.1 putative membrane protein [Rhodoblastus acidophilus]MTV32385.1 flippase-like domain-containing protein [Rhodoblastus acidophilus]
MKKAAALGLVLGLLLFAALTFYEGVGEVAHAFGRIGLVGALLIAVIRFAQTFGAAFAWRFMIPKPRPAPWIFCQLRWVRESINNLLPVASVGGDVFGARLLKKRRVDGGVAAASVVVDLLAQTATQAVFTMIGVVLLLRAGVEADLTLAAAVGAIIMVPAIAGFWLAPRLLSMGWIDRLAQKIEAQTGWPSVVGLPALRQGLDVILRNRAGLARALAIHMTIWFVGALEIYFALQFLGDQRSFATAITIESLGHAVKAAGFLIPGAWGVQEGGFIALCAAFGIGSPNAIALSLIKRIPDLICGAPGLALWRRLEGESLFATVLRAKRPAEEAGRA